MLRNAARSHLLLTASPTGRYRYITSCYGGGERELLLQALEMRSLIVLLDGVDEAAGHRAAVEDFVLGELVPSGNRLVVTSRPEG